MMCSNTLEQCTTFSLEMAKLQLALVALRKRSSASGGNPLLENKCFIEFGQSYISNFYTSEQKIEFQTIWLPSSIVLLGFNRRYLSSKWSNFEWALMAVKFVYCHVTSRRGF